MGFINKLFGKNEFRCSKEEKQIKKSLRDDDCDIRREAMARLQTLGKINDPELLRLLTLSLMDEDGGVALTSRKVIDEIRPNWQDTEDAKQLVPAFIDGLKFNEAGYTAFGSIYALGKIKDKLAVKPLLELVKSSYHDKRLRAILALGEIKDTGALEPLIEVLDQRSGNNDDPWFLLEEQKAAAAWALGEVCDVQAIRPLISALGDMNDHKYVNYKIWCAENSLKKIGSPSIEPLIEALAASDSDKIRYMAAKTLGGINDIVAVEPLILAIENEKGTIVAHWANVSLKKIIGEGHVDKMNDWKEWWKDNKNSFKKTKHEKDIHTYIKHQLFG